MRKDKKRGPDGQARLARPRSANGQTVDVTLIRWMLSLSPEERIRALEDNIHALKRLKNAKRAAGFSSDSANADGK
ncbi:MAG: hypothetical protein KGZ25_05485 [Planctomycetes bacterium]|nr:hypothetical protein [Planctomycetota bacterium]